MKWQGLYAITPDWPDSTRLLTACEKVVEAGVGALQLRRKSVPEAVIEQEAFALARLCAARGVPFIVNDNAALARKVAAAGVHIGRADGGVAAARRALAAGQVIGVSCYADPALARSAEEAGADYVAVGSVFSSPTKPGAPVAGLIAVAGMRAATKLPLVAIGGIRRDNLASVRAAGADMAAIINDLFETGDPGENAREMARLWRAENVCKE